MREGIWPLEGVLNPWLRPRRVLIFDKDIDELVHYAEPFENQGFEVHKCAFVESAMRCVEREAFDLALVVQDLPAFEGRRVLAHLVRYNFPVPLIVLAQPWIQEFCQQALKLGATEYLEKPISSTEIERIIKNFLESSRGELRGQGFGRKAELPQK